MQRWTNPHLRLALPAATLLAAHLAVPTAQSTKSQASAAQDPGRQPTAADAPDSALLMRLNQPDRFRSACCDFAGSSAAPCYRDGIRRAGGGLRRSSGSDAGNEAYQFAKIRSAGTD